jgi:hypothetical protein
VTRPRLALLQRVARDVAQAARRRGRPPEVQRTSDTPADELARRLDETRERLRREIPPTDPEDGLR